SRTGPRYHPAWRPPHADARSLAGCDGPDPSGSTGAFRPFFRRLTGDGRVVAFRAPGYPTPVPPFIRISPPGPVSVREHGVKCPLSHANAAERRSHGTVLRRHDRHPTLAGRRYVERVRPARRGV